MSYGCDRGEGASIAVAMAAAEGVVGVQVAGAGAGAEVEVRTPDSGYSSVSSPPSSRYISIQVYIVDVDISSPFD